MISDKDTKAIQWGKSSKQQMLLKKLDIHMQKEKKKKRKVDLYLTPYT